MKVLPRYQDRRKCPVCGTLLERFMTVSEDGRDINLPVLLPASWCMAHNITFASGEVVHVQTKRRGRIEETGSDEFVAFDYFCLKCNRAMNRSNTWEWRGELPQTAYYTPGDEQPDVMAEVRSRARSVAN